MKSDIVFLPVPKSFRRQLDSNAQDEFAINPGIPIPVEIPKDGENLNIENLSMDMIVSGMLRVIEEGEVQKEWLDYYSNFVLTLRPDILTKLKEIRDNGLNDECFLKARNLLQEGKAEEGLGFIHDFLQRQPLVWNGWFVLGWALRLLGRWKDGEAAFRKAIELDGGGSDVRNELAICLMEMGDISGAIRELEAALGEDPENIKIISNLGVLALKNGEEEKAAAFFRTVLELDSDDPVAVNFFEK